MNVSALVGARALCLRSSLPDTMGSLTLINGVTPGIFASSRSSQPYQLQAVETRGPNAHTATRTQLGESHIPPGGHATVSESIAHVARPLGRQPVWQALPEAPPPVQPNKVQLALAGKAHKGTGGEDAATQAQRGHDTASTPSRTWAACA